MKKLTVTILTLLCGLPAIAQTTQERLTDHVYTLASDSLRGRKFGTVDALRSARYVAARFEEAGLTPYYDSMWFQPFEAWDRKGNNIIGMLPGNDPELKDEWIILGAHFDHLGAQSKSRIYHGADDNASGTAVLIEAARNLAGRRDELRRSVMFVAFDGEESGLYGSAHLAQNLPEGEVKFMASIDMVGWLHKGKRLKIAGVAMLDHGNEIFRSVDSAGEWLRLKNFDTMILGGSDHEPFALRGIPAMYISTGLKSPYHKPEDTADKIDYEGMTLITGYMTDLTASMASRDELEASGRRSFKHKDEPRLEFGLTASVGDNSHSYKRGALEGKSAIAWNAGVWAHINFGNWTLRPKVLYEQRNALMPVDFEQRTSTTLRTGGVYVPLDVMYKLRVGGMRGVYLYAFCGGYYSRIFNARIGGDRVDFSSPGAMRRNEWGWQIGGGMNLYKFWLEGTYRRGLTDVFPEGGITNNTGFVSLGYKF